MSNSKVTDAGIIERFTTAVNALVREKKLYGEDLETFVEVKRILAERQRLCAVCGKSNTYDPQSGVCRKCQDVEEPQQCAVVTDEMEKRAILAAEKWASDNGFVAYMVPTGYVRAALVAAQLGVRVPEGYALAPVEPTDKMLKAGQDAHYEAEDLMSTELNIDPVDYAMVKKDSMRIRKNRAKHVFKAMLQATPEVGL
jgi:hypothetical protein